MIVLKMVLATISITLITVSMIMTAQLLSGIDNGYLPKMFMGGAFIFASALAVTAIWEYILYSLNQNKRNGRTK